MGAGHGRGPATGMHARLFVPGSSVVHRIDPTVKLLGVLALVIVVAVTPGDAWPVFAAAASAVAAVAAVARLRPGMLLARLSPVVPFLGLAAITPFVSGGTRTSIDLGWFTLGVSHEGAAAGAAIAIRVLLGGAATSVLAATTPVPEIVRALTRLRVPAVVVAIFGFMVRFVDVLADELARMRRAMVARCHDPRWLWHIRPVATSVGTLFVRSYERGERVHHAMVARGFTGAMPDLDDRPGTSGIHRALAFAPAAVTAAALAAWSLA